MTGHADMARSFIYFVYTLGMTWKKNSLLCFSNSLFSEMQMHISWHIIWGYAALRNNKMVYSVCFW